MGTIPAYQSFSTMLGDNMMNARSEYLALSDEAN
jgi:hypothetical protein